MRDEGEKMVVWSLFCMCVRVRVWCSGKGEAQSTKMGLLLSQDFCMCGYACTCGAQDFCSRIKELKGFKYNKYLYFLLKNENGAGLGMGLERIAL